MEKPPICYHVGCKRESVPILQLQLPFVNLTLQYLPLPRTVLQRMGLFATIKPEHTVEILLTLYFCKKHGSEFLESLQQQAVYKAGYMVQHQLLKFFTKQMLQIYAGAWGFDHETTSQWRKAIKAEKYMYK